MNAVPFSMIHRIASAALLTLLAVAPAVRADTLVTVTDGFEGAILDPQQWRVAAKKPAVAVTLAGQRLNYVTSAFPSDDDYLDLEFLAVRPAYDKDWEVVVDVSNTAVRNGPGDWSGVGMSIMGAQNLSPTRADCRPEWRRSFQSHGLCAGRAT
jgi:hypothetical protein